MSSYEILFFAGGGVALGAFLYLVLAKPAADNLGIAVATFGGFVGFTAITIAAEGPLGFLQNQQVNLWGVQVWYDLIIALAIAITFVAPRAKAAGMNVLVYIIATGLTGSIGLLAMVARLFWLERHRTAAGA